MSDSSRLLLFFLTFLVYFLFFFVTQPTVEEGLAPILIVRDRSRVQANDCKLTSCINSSQ